MLSSNVKQVLSDLQTLFVMVGFIILPRDLILWSLLTTWIVCNCVMIIVHEGWGHNIFTPKNRYIGYLLDLIGYIGTTIFPVEKYSTKFAWKFNHANYHRYWKTELDIDQWMVDNNNWFVCMFFSAHTKTKSISSMYDVVAKKEYDRMLSTMDPISRAMDIHSNKIIIVVHLLMLLILGLEYYFYFIFVPVFFFNPCLKLFGEILPHKGKKTKDDDYDISWLFPIIGSVAYHAYHHRTGKTNLGSNILKYFNIQYYFVRLVYSTPI